MRNRLVRIFIAQVVELKVDAGKQLGIFSDRLRMILEQSPHFGGRSQMTFAIGAQQLAGLLDRGAFADAGDDIV